MAWPTPLPEEGPEERPEENPPRPPCPPDPPPWPLCPPPLPDPPGRACKPMLPNNPASITTATRIQSFMTDIPCSVSAYSTSLSISTLRRAVHVRPLANEAHGVQRFASTRGVPATRRPRIPNENHVRNGNGRSGWTYRLGGRAWIMGYSSGIGLGKSGRPLASKCCLETMRFTNARELTTRLQVTISVPLA